MFNGVRSSRYVIAHWTLASRSPIGEVFLLPHGICLSEPRAKLAVDLVELLEAEGMEMVAWGERLYAPESGILEASREHDVAIEPGAARRHLREGHAHVERDARLLGEDLHWPDVADGGHHGVEQRANLRRLPGEMVLEIVASARV